MIHHRFTEKFPTLRPDTRYRVVASAGELQWQIDMAMARAQRGLPRSTVEAVDWLARFKPDALEKLIGAHTRREQRLIRAHLSRNNKAVPRVTSQGLGTASLFEKGTPGHG